MNAPKYSPLEREIIILKAVLDLIDEMVNYEIFVKFERLDDTNMLPNTPTHQKHFNVLLNDFLSLPTGSVFELAKPPNGAIGSDRSYLFLLKQVVNNPQFKAGTINEVREPVEEFSRWLDQEFTLEKAYMPSIDKELDLTLSRISFIKVCGNISKHNFSRMERDANLIADIFAANGFPLDEDMRYLVLPDFFERFHDDLFNYHISTIAEFLNNIRWGVHAYLRTEWDNSYTPDKTDRLKYEYVIPAECNRAIARSMYWELMNRVRSGPSVPRFSVTRFLKLRY